MKLLELHILQSFPVSCLNRDDAGIPKTAFFGGVNRARLSSQCLKRAVREKAREINAGLFQGSRTKLIGDCLMQRINQLAPALDSERVLILAKAALPAFGKQDEKDPARIKALYFLAPAEIAAVASALVERFPETANEWAALDAVDEEKDENKAAKVRDKAMKTLNEAALKETGKVLKTLAKSGGHLKDAVDIALFGRMVADSPDLNIDGASYFSHALSTHEAEAQQDYYSAVDDMQRQRLDNREENAHAGSGMLGHLEYTSATYYRYAALNLDLLLEPQKGYLRELDADEKKAAISAFIEAALVAIPRARRTGMNSDVLPAYALGTYRATGGPVQLIYAFEHAVPPRDTGYLEPSVETLLKHQKGVAEIWEIVPEVAVATGFPVPAAASGSVAPEHLPKSAFINKLVTAVLP